MSENNKKIVNEILELLGSKMLTVETVYKVLDETKTIIDDKLLNLKFNMAEEDVPEDK